MSEKVIELIRVSTADQAKEGKAGLDRQKSDNQRTIEKYNLEKVSSIEIVDVSGTEVNRCPQIQKLIKMMQNRMISGVVVSDIDRLIRPDNYDDYSLLQRFRETGTKIYTHDNILDLNTQTGFLLGGISSTIAGNELTQIRKRMMGGKEEKRKQGKHPNNKITLPTGVKYDKVKGKFEYNEDSAKVKIAFDMILQGCTYREIERRTGIYHHTIPNLLRNEIFTGYRTYLTKTGDKVSGKRYRKKIKRNVNEIIRVKVFDTPLINEDTFNKVQYTVNNKREDFRARRKNNPSRFWLHGFLYCGKCGQPMYAFWTNRRSELRGDHRDDYYFCKTLKTCYRKKLHKCDSKWVKREIISENVDEFLTCLLSKKEFLTELVNGYEKNKNANSFEDYDLKIKDTKAKLNELEGKRERLLKLYIEGTFTKEELDKEHDKIKKSIEANNFCLEETLIKKDKAFEKVDKRLIYKIAGTFAEFKFLSDEDKRDILYKFVPKIFTIEGKVTGLGIATSERASLSNSLSFCLKEVKINPPFETGKPMKTLNKWGLEQKGLYLTKDVCKLLKISPKLYYWREKTGKYPKVARRGRIRVFTIEEVEKIRQIE